MLVWAHSPSIFDQLTGLCCSLQGLQAGRRAVFIFWTARPCRRDPPQLHGASQHGARLHAGTPRVSHAYRRDF